MEIEESADDHKIYKKSIFVQKNEMPVISSD